MERATRSRAKKLTLGRIGPAGWRACFRFARLYSRVAALRNSCFRCATPYSRVVTLENRCSRAPLGPQGQSRLRSAPSRAGGGTEYWIDAVLYCWYKSICHKIAVYTTNNETDIFLSRQSNQLIYIQTCRLSIVSQDFWPQTWIFRHGYPSAYTSQS